MLTGFQVSFSKTINTFVSHPDLKEALYFYQQKGATRLNFGEIFEAAELSWPSYYPWDKSYDILPNVLFLIRIKRWRRPKRILLHDCS